MLESLKLYMREIKAALIVALLIGGYIAVRDYLDMKAKLAEQQAMMSTVASKFEKFGDAYTTTNKILTDKQATQEAAVQLLGANVVKYMQDQNARMTSLYSAVGDVRSSIAEVKAIVGGSRDSNGVIKDAFIPQDRKGLAPLTGLNVNYDPTKPLAAAFNGSQWRNNQEHFDVSLGEWRLKDGGYRAAFKIERQVMDDKGNPVGPKEPITLTSAEGQFTPDKFQLGPQVPRFTLTPMAGFDFVDKKWKPGIVADYRMTDKIGVSGGQVGPMTVLGLSWRFNINK